MPKKNRKPIRPEESADKDQDSTSLAAQKKTDQKRPRPWERGFTGANEFFGRSANLGSKLSGVFTSFLGDNELLRHLGKVTDSPASVYDKALDSEYLKSQIGGGDHRLFDGGHDLFSAWAKAKDALPNDSFGQEVLGYTTSLWKDFTTVKGLPFTTLSQDSFNNWVEAVGGWIPGIDRKYLYDMLSFDAYEVLSVGLGVVSVVFVLKKEDQEKLAELLGSMGIISILSANPLMGIFVLITSAYAYTKKKMEFDKSAFAKSSTVTATSMALFSLLGLPILFELVLVGVIAHLFRKKILDNSEFEKYFRKEIRKSMKAHGAKAKVSISDFLKNRAALVNKKVG